jgi:hypothetical protein
MLNKSQLTIKLALIYADLSPTKTALTTAIATANAIDEFTKTGSIKTGTLSSSGTGNLGAPVSSNNTSGGEIE